MDDMDDTNMDKRGISEETIEELRRWVDGVVDDTATVVSASGSVDAVVDILGIEPDGGSYARDMANIVRLFVDEIEKAREVSACRAFSFYADLAGKPVRDGESLEGWLNRWYCERPLDADGNPWEIGDECVRLGEEVVVSGYLSGDGVLVTLPSGSTKCCYASSLARPLLDADGVRIRKGDTVWDLDSGEKLLVVELSNREHGMVQCSNEDDGDCEDHDARRLTHREPDSLEKLRDDMMTTQFSDVKEKAIEWSDRLTALMERGA